MTRPERSIDNETDDDRNLPSDSLNVLQLSDPHLFANPEGRLLGMRTLASLQHVIAHANKNQPSTDLALVTGDLVHDASPAGYSLLKKQLTDLNVPTYCLPGNHDDPKILNASVSGNPVDTPFSIKKKNWLIILLNSNLPGSEGGHLDDAELSKLQSCLISNPNLHTLVCLHHHTVPINSKWLDTMILDNADAFFDIIDQHPQIKGVTCGHIHQAFEKRRKNTLLMGTPSTCFQFAPKSTEFGLDSKSPGYRQLALLPDGSIITKVIHLKTYPSSVDRSSSGY